MRAVTYSRFSTDRQNESSIGDQQRVVSEYACAQGWQIAEHYSDAGISGAAMGNRPGFLKMRADAMARRFDVLLLMDTTRLCRSGELQPLVERLRFQGVRVVGVQDQFDSSTGFSDMQASMSGAMSIEFRRMIKARTHAALESRARVGRSAGGRAFGSDNSGAVIEADAAIVREIFARAGQGASCRAIAGELNARGKAKFLLSGLLRCDVCGAHYVMGDARAYVCSSFVNGAACSNAIRVRRSHAESVPLAPVRDGLLAPDRVERMAVEMETISPSSYVCAPRVPLRRPGNCASSRRASDGCANGSSGATRI